jgi:hypothetical protein
MVLDGSRYVGEAGLVRLVVALFLAFGQSDIVRIENFQRIYLIVQRRILFHRFGGDGEGQFLDLLLGGHCDVP